MTVVRRIVELLNGATDITLLIHQHPDGDAIGSSVALYEALTTVGKRPRIVCAQQIAPVFSRIVGRPIVEQKLPDKTDLILLLDCGEAHRTGFGRQLKNPNLKTKIVVIDHHPKGDLYKLATHYHSDESASATAEIIVDYLRELRQKITAPIATALLLGIYTDTGGFQHANTTSRTLRLASRLISFGGNLNLITETFWRQLSPAKKRLWGKILSEIQISRCQILTAVVSQDHLQIAGATDEDVSGLANYLSLTHEAKAALVLLETETGWRGTLRTRHSGIDLSQLAKFFGGKGQKKAAGFITTKEVFSGKI